MKYSKGIVLLILVFLISISAASAKECGGSTACACGDTITEDYVVQSDILECGDFALEVEDNVVLDCNQHLLQGSGSGILALDKFNFEIKNCKFKDFQTGIEIKDSRVFRITSNTIVSSNGEEGILVQNAGINNFITDNMVEGYKTGIKVENSGNTHLTENVLLENGYGIQYLQSLGRISKNMAEKNDEDGILVVGGWAQMDNNQLQNNKGNGLKLQNTQMFNLNMISAQSNGQAGILLEDCSQGFLYQSSLYGNKIGLQLVRSSMNDIRSNTFDKNTEYGVLVSESDDNVLWKNTFKYNKESISEINSEGNVWQNNEEDKFWTTMKEFGRKIGFGF